MIEGNLTAPANMSERLQNTLQIIVEGRHTKKPMYDSVHCHDRIKEVCQSFIEHPITEFIAAPKGFGVDIWLRKEGTDYFFDTKTVQSNIGGYTKYINQIFNWYAYFYAQNPRRNASARIVFPYNLYESENLWNKTIGRGWPLEPNTEEWGEDEFRNFCSGIDNTYSQIHRSFISISESGELEDLIQKIFYGNTYMNAN